MGRNVRRYHRVFVEHNGTGPWACSECGVGVNKIGTGSLDGHVHHKDHNHTNDVASNLEILHNRCHARHHLLGATYPRDRVLKMVASHSYEFDAEDRDHMSLGHVLFTCSHCGRRTTREGLTRFHVPNRDHCPTRKFKPNRRRDAVHSM